MWINRKDKEKKKLEKDSDKNEWRIMLWIISIKNDAFDPSSLLQQIEIKNDNYDNKNQ